MTEPRLFIFGWDAADWAVIEEGWRLGKLPVLKRLAGRGATGTLMSTNPPLTPSAWTSFLTGADPGEHGIFNFRTLRHANHRVVPTTGGSRRVPSLFRGLDTAGIRTCQVTVPWTYPAERLEHGVVVPGWDDPGESFDTTWPPEAAELLASAPDVPRVPRRTSFHGEAGAHLRKVAEDLGVRERICDLLMERFDPQVFMVVYVEPDRAGHLLWSAGPVPPALVDAYELVDAAMGRFMDRWVREDDVVLVLSDHGTRPVHSVVQVAPLLEAGGLLAIARNTKASPTLARMVRRSIWSRIPPRLRNRLWRTVPSKVTKKASRTARRSKVDWERTTAFPLGTTLGVGVWINADPPFAGGIVPAEGYADARDRVTRCLMAVTDPDSGEPVFEAVLPREQVYAGRAVPDAPDLVLVPREGYGASQGVGVGGTVNRVATGGHRPEGVFLASRDLGLGETLGIEDLFPRVLGALGYPCEAAPEGWVSEEPETDMTDHEAEEIEERLRDLGYIE